MHIFLASDCKMLSKIEPPSTPSASSWHPPSTGTRPALSQPPPEPIWNYFLLISRPLANSKILLSCRRELNFALFRPPKINKFFQPASSKPCVSLETSPKNSIFQTCLELLMLLEKNMKIELSPAREAKNDNFDYTKKTIFWLP